MSHRIFITGGTGYVGQSLIPALIDNGHQVTALVRPASRTRVEPRCGVVTGDALHADSYLSQLSGHDTLIHLVGVSHPSPAKAREFVLIDLRSAEEAIRAARLAGIAHFIYVSVAQPAPVMKAYIDVRAKCEAALRASGLNATIVRPWYVLGPGHRWPAVLKPLYAVAELLPSWREGARRLGLVTLRQMVRTLATAVEMPPVGIKILGVPEIRSSKQQ